MKKRITFIGIVILTLLASCQPTVAPTVQSTVIENTVVPAASSDIVLSVVNNSTEKEYTLGTIKALPSVEGQAGLKSSTGKIFLPALYKGVLLTDFLKEVGGDDPAMAVEVEAKDGYSMTYTYEQVAKGIFIMYDPATGEEITDAGPLQVILAYSTEGKDLDPEQDGYLRLMVISKEGNQVVDGHWATKFVTKLTVKPLVEEWALEMEGAINYKVDRGSFESCSTAKCHPASWTDTKSQIWAGVPLYMLIGEVDDENKHDAGGYNKALAQAGYTIDLIAKDGYTVSLDSKVVDGNQNILVAYTMNDNPLNDKDFPLKLVGPDLDKKQSIGGIAKIVLHIDPIQIVEATLEPTVEPTVAPTDVPTKGAASEPVSSDSVALEFKGKVETPQQWTLDALKAMDVVKVTVDGPKDKKVTAEGIRISDLFKAASAKSEAKTLVIKAADGYLAEVGLKSLASCTDCMVAFDKNDTLKMVMPGMDSSIWVKEVVSLELK